MDSREDLGCSIFWSVVNIKPISKLKKPNTLGKLCLSTKFSHQEIRWGYGIFCTETNISLTNLIFTRLPWNVLKNLDVLLLHQIKNYFNYTFKWVRVKPYICYVLATKTINHAPPIVQLYFNPVLHFIQKSVIYFALQNKWPTFIWNAKLGWNGLTLGNSTTWSNTFKQFASKLTTICLSVFVNFVGLALKGLKLLLHWLQISRNRPRLS